MRQKAVVLCIKWGNAFTPDYVNVLFRATTAFLNQKFLFVCLTDRTDGLDAGILTRPIPDVGLTDKQISAPGVWRKLALFHPSVADISPGARALFIDLDMMITGNLDRFLVPTSKIVLLDTGHDWRAKDPVQPSTGVFAFNLGEQHHILKKFKADPACAMQKFRNEQDFVAANCEGMSLWPNGLVISFKRHLVRRYGKDLLFGPRRPYSGPAILAFHGEPRPVDLMNTGFWGRFPHLGLGPVDWALEYWKNYGGTTPLQPDGHP